MSPRDSGLKDSSECRKRVMEEFEDEDWADSETLYALETACRNGMPARAAGVFARWWQLETWLPDLMHVELRAKHGRAWDGVVVRATGRHAVIQRQGIHYPT